MAPLLLDELFQAELFDPVADLPQGQSQVHGRLGLDPAVALQGGQDLPLFHLFQPGQKGLILGGLGFPGRGEIRGQVLDADFGALDHDAEALHQVSISRTLPGQA